MCNHCGMETWEHMFSLWDENMGTHVFTVEWKHGNTCIHCEMETGNMCIHCGMETWEHMKSLWNENMGTHAFTVE